MKQLISKDIQEKKATNTLATTTLFRENSFASKSFKTFAKIVGLPYLFFTLGDPIYEITNEFDPDKLKEKEKEETKGKSLRRKKGDSQLVELNDVVVNRSSTMPSMFDVGNVEMDPNK